MHYEIIDNITSADIAVRVKAPSLELLFNYSAEALMSELVEDISSIQNKATREGTIEGEDISLIYFEFLNEFLFFKDSESLLLVPCLIRISAAGNIFSCSYTLCGEKINKNFHKFKTDIKAVTLHGLRIYQRDGLYIAETVFDV